MTPDLITTLAIILEVILLAGIGRFAWQNRKNKLLFWGWLAVITMFVVADIAFFSGLLSK
jgi:hypothetical protein